MRVLVQRWGAVEGLLPHEHAVAGRRFTGAGASIRASWTLLRFHRLKIPTVSVPNVVRGRDVFTNLSIWVAVMILSQHLRLRGARFIPMAGGKVVGALLLAGAKASVSCTPAGRDGLYRRSARRTCPRARRRSRRRAVGRACPDRRPHEVGGLGEASPRRRSCVSRANKERVAAPVLQGGAQGQEA